MKRNFFLMYMQVILLLINIHSWNILHSFGNFDLSEFSYKVESQIRRHKMMQFNDII